MDVRALAHRERAPEELTDDLAAQANATRRFERVAHLAQNLRLTDDHRVQAGRDAKRVAYGLVLAHRIEMRPELGLVQSVVLREKPA